MARGRQRVLGGGRIRSVLVGRRVRAGRIQRAAHLLGPSSSEPSEARSYRMFLEVFPRFVL